MFNPLAPRSKTISSIFNFIQIIQIKSLSGFKKMSVEPSSKRHLNKRSVYNPALKKASDQNKKKLPISLLKRKRFVKFKQFITSNRRLRKFKKLIKWKVILKNAHLVIPNRFQIINTSELAKVNLVKNSNKESTKTKLIAGQPNLSSAAPNPFQAIAEIPSDLVKILSSSFNFKKLSEIQLLGIPAILHNKSIVLAAETGTGKTLTYLIPLLIKLKLSEKSDSSTSTHKVPIISPRCIIFAPTRELAIQLISVVKLLSKQYHLRSGIILPNYTKKDLVKCIPSLAGETKASIDILITHPSAFSSMMRNRYLYFRGTSNPSSKSQLPKSTKLKPLINMDNLRHLVFDEADILMCPSSSENEWNADLAFLCSLPLLKSLLFISASITKPFFNNVFKKLTPNVKLVQSSELHKPLDIVKQHFYKVAAAGLSKPKMCAKILESNPGSYFIVFCNTIKSATSLYRYLQSTPIFPRVSILTGSMPAEERDNAVASFRKNSSKILICTDVGSRGLDFPLVNHVILYDFPQNPIGFIHRIGRTGRAGKGGIISSLITNRDKRLLKFIQMAIYKHCPLDTQN